MTRARKNQIVVNLNTLAGKVVDTTNRTGGTVLVYDPGTDTYIHQPQANGSVQEVADQSSLPATGETGVLYYITETGETYRWDSISNTYIEYKTVQEFQDIREKPITLAGYGIIDAWTKSDIGDPATNYVAIFEAALI